MNPPARFVIIFAGASEHPLPLYGVHSVDHLSMRLLENAARLVEQISGADLRGALPYVIKDRVTGGIVREGSWYR